MRMRSLNVLSAKSLGFLALFLLLGGIGAASGLVFDHAIRESAESGTVINLSGRQRMLTTRIESLLTRLAVTEDPKVIEDIRDEVGDLVATIERAHVALLDGNPKLQIPASSSEAIRAIYENAPHNLDRSMADYLSSVRNLLGSWVSETSEPADTLPQIWAMRNTVVAGLESLTRQFELENRTKIVRIETAGEVLLVFLFLSLFGIWAFVFHPMELRVTRTSRALTHETHERKITTAQLELSRAVFENTSEGILVTDPDRHVIDVNKAYSDITGFDRSEVMGRPAGVAGSGRHDRKFYAEMWRSISTEGKWSGEIWNRHKSGGVFPAKLTINAVKGNDGEITNYIGVFSDISHLKESEEKLTRLAYFDHLTGLANRISFRDRLEREISAARRKEHGLAVLFFDVDRFKTINDTLGHVFGDDLLVKLARRVSDVLRSEDTLVRTSPYDMTSDAARFGGDEFIVLVSGLHEPSEVSHVAKRIIDALSRPMTIQGREIAVTVSIGVSVFPEDGDNADTLIKNADSAMYRAKRAGRGQYQFFEPELDQLSHAKLALEQDLRKAVEKDELFLCYQPKIDANSLAMVGMEALIRWQKEDGTIVPPSDFIPLAEETGLIVPIGLWILETACRQNKRWADVGRRLRVAVNLSARQFNQPNLVATIEGVLSSTGLPPELLELEITESMVIGDIDKTTDTLMGLRNLGVHVSIDDFGTGYSSLSMLKQLPINTMKIDRSFIRDMTTDSDDDAIVSAIIAMARKLGLKTVAEGVESEEQLVYLAQRGCDLIQGYYFSKPLTPDRFAEFPMEVEVNLVLTG